MHINHFFRLKADSHETAQRIVFGEILEWVNENNTADVLGSFCKDDNTYDIANGMSEDFEESRNEIIELLCYAAGYINAELERPPYTLTPYEFVDQFSDESKVGLSDWAKLAEYADWKMNTKQISGQVDIWSENYKSGCYDERGITGLDHQVERDKSKKTFLRSLQKVDSRRKIFLM